MSSNRYDCLTITLNPAIDRTITIPNFQAGKVNRVQGEYLNAGGKGVNVASSLADAGHKVAVTGFLGRENVTVFERLFARKRISDHFVRLEGETRVGIKITDPVLKETTDINFPGAEPLPSDLAALRSAVDQIDAEWFVFAGSLPPGVETTIYRDLTQSLKTRGRKVALDTSGETLNHAIEALPAFIKPNIHELEGLVGRALPSREAVVAAARELVARGIEMVVVSMGEQGACFIGAEGVIFATPPTIEVRSTVGAGDAMVAGVLSAKLRGLPLADVARLSTAFSVRAIGKLDGDVSIDAIAQKVTVQS
ncbi:MAG TPA: 1-phosphofructokinase [Terrimicrobiaceae bacterium]